MPALFPFLPMPLFWALFGQMASRWTLQSTHMNTQIEIFGLFAFTIKADQIGVINALLVTLMVPLFKYAIFPLMTKMRLCLRPLQNMTIGSLLAALSFLFCALVQQHLELVRLRFVCCGCGSTVHTVAHSFHPTVGAAGGHAARSSPRCPPERRVLP